MAHSRRASTNTLQARLLVLTLAAASLPVLILGASLSRGKELGLLAHRHTNPEQPALRPPPKLDDEAGFPAGTWHKHNNLFFHKAPKYHVYELPEDMGYDQCQHSRSPDFKHNIDKLFVHKLNHESKSVPPEEADIFIVPEMLSQHMWNLCKNHHWREQLRDFLEASPWFQRYNGSDHLLIGDHYSWTKTGNIFRLAEIPGRVIVGHFESYHSEAKLAHRFFPVGYSTYAALHVRGWDTSAYTSKYDGDSDISNYHAELVPFAERKYDVSFVGQVDRRDAYKYRRQLACSWRVGGHKLGARFFVGLGGHSGRCESKATPGDHPLSGEPLAVAEAAVVMQQSRFFLCLTGDTPSTDRLYNAFDTLTIPVALASTVDIIIDNAPFQDVVPWRDIIVTVDDGAWKANPMSSVLDAIDALPADEVVMKYQLMKRHADDVSFANLETTRAHTNIINAAWKIAMEQLRELSPVVEPAEPGNNVYWPFHWQLH